MWRERNREKERKRESWDRAVKGDRGQEEESEEQEFDTEKRKYMERGNGNKKVNKGGYLLRAVGDS